MPTLHTVNKSPFEKESLSRCLRLLSSDASVLLIEDAVYGAMSKTCIEPSLRAALAHNKVYCLEPDLLARGFTREQLIAGVVPISYEGFVELVIAHQPIQTWL